MKILQLLLFSLLTASCSLPRWPVQAPMTSPFGLRFRGLLPDLHRGVDLSVPVGTPVAAMDDGDVTFAGEMRGYGLVVILRHGSNVRSVYAHLSELRVRRGERVHGGQIIALSGQTGNATAPHLHFEVYRFGYSEDPVSLLGGLP